MGRRLILALVAHVDAGKTTLSESMLYGGGMLRRMGRVDHGDSYLDGDKIERERGITVFSKQAVIHTADVEITLMDTPGHTDLAAEAERVLHVCDAAVLLISAPDGVQAHTETLWQLLRHNHIPTVLFINKADMPGTDLSAVIQEVRKKLSGRCVPVQSGQCEEDIAFCSDEALDEYTENGCVSLKTKRGLFEKELLFPLLCGSALKMQGIDELMRLLCDMAPDRSYSDVFSATVYKVTRDKQDNRLTWLRVTGGKLTSKQVICYTDDKGISHEEKIERIRIYSGDRAEQTDEAFAGGVYAVLGLSATYPGLGLGGAGVFTGYRMEPVFTCRLNSPDTDPVHLLRAVRLLEEEDPTLHAAWNAGLHEVSVQLMGDIQKEVLLRRLKDRFGMTVLADDGGILYKETIRNTVEGVGHYEPLRHYAEAHLLLQPLERGRGLIFDSQCSEDDLDRNWQRLILTHLYEKQHLGVLTGSPITDMRISLVSGRAHLKHTEGGDFRQATYRAVRNGLMKAESVLLEPYYAFTLKLPREYLGRAMTDLDRIGAEFAQSEDSESTVTLAGKAPVRLIRGYARDLSAYTGGKGRMNCVFAGYMPCKDADTVIRMKGYAAERDIDNTADSVFCSHGAGFCVRWDEVDKYMHLPYMNMRSAHAADEAAAPVREESKKAKMSSLEEDKELMRIFERTYGPVRPRAFDKPPREHPVLPEQVTVVPEEEYLLIDGYNVIFAWDELKKLSEYSLEDARYALAEILCNFQGVRKTKVILVFDAYRIKNNPGKTGPYKNITVVYTAEAETADNYIEKYTANIKKPYSMRVVTGDQLEQIITMGHGALRTSSREFRREVENANIEIRRILDFNNRPRGEKRVAEAMMAAVRKNKR